MFKNNVFNTSVNTKKWIKAAGIRAIKTMAQTVIASVAVGSAITEIDWLYVLSVTATAGIISICTSLTGIPEVTEEDDEDE